MGMVFLNLDEDINFVAKPNAEAYLICDC